MQFAYGYVGIDITKQTSRTLQDPQPSQLTRLNGSSITLVDLDHRGLKHMYSALCSIPRYPATSDVVSNFQQNKSCFNSASNYHTKALKSSLSLTRSKIDFAFKTALGL